jgi:hypothetical protein
MRGFIGEEGWPGHETGAESEGALKKAASIATSIVHGEMSLLGEEKKTLPRARMRSALQRGWLLNAQRSEMGGAKLAGRRGVDAARGDGAGILWQRFSGNGGMCSGTVRRFGAGDECRCEFRCAGYATEDGL